MGIFSQIIFMQPIILTALMVLPILWYLLRITPPAPKNIFFPAARFLVNLQSQEQTSNKTPWWILLLRLMIVGLIIIALAKPVINPSDKLNGQNDVRIIIDNGWASAQNWDEAINSANEIITQAGRENRNIYILPTISDKQYGALTSVEALSILKGLTPNPWAADYKNLAENLADNRPDKPLQTIWLSHGLDNGGINKAIKIVQNQGGVRYVQPAPENMPLLLRPAQKITKKGQNNIRINIDAPSNIAKNTTVIVQAIGQDSDVIDLKQIKLSPNDLPKIIEFEVLGKLKNKITHFKVIGNKSSGSIFLLDDQFNKRNVGIVSLNQKSQSSSLTDPEYYIERAISPYADIKIGAIQNLINEDLSVIILPDIAAMPSETLNNLEEWVKNGGVLLRFAGDKMAKTRGEQFLLPVRLRSGGRSISGSLTWGDAQKIAPFLESSPFYGLEIPDNVTVNQQILTDPAQDLEGKIWSSLEDGTPLITADTIDKGLVVLIHTSANTDWSNFAISGLYVSVLKRIIRMSGRSNITLTNNHKYLDPILTLDGFGKLSTPPISARPIAVSDLDKIMPSAKHPPGIYGKGQMRYALNIGENAPKLNITSNLPFSVTQEYYSKKYEINIAPIILSIAFMLFLIDWIIMIFIAGNISRLIRKVSISTAIIFAFIHPAIATETQFANDLHLAYINTGDRTLDALAQKGLESLSNALKTRTSIEPAGVTGLNPETDNLAFFPLIYWAVNANHKTYSTKAMHNIQNYLDHGGTIIFDTRDQNQSTGSFNNTPNAKALRKITSNLNIPQIIPAPDDHVLGRAFYLLDNYPGRYSSGTLWVEKHSGVGRDNVSSVLIGSNDWIGSWADAYEQEKYTRYNMRAKSRQKELSLRFGINLVMYALTGNYKADQVHIPHILKRLDK